MSFLNGFLDNVVSGALSPKGNLADYQHGARLFVDDSHRLTPKVKFLYHVTFNINAQDCEAIRAKAIQLETSLDKANPKTYYDYAMYIRLQVVANNNCINKLYCYHDNWSWKYICGHLWCKNFFNSLSNDFFNWISF